MTNRDDFDSRTKEVIARRVAYRCSNPYCRKLTVGPQADPAKSLNIGVAAHITAAAEGGPRYDPHLTPAQRSHADNGLWLCQDHAHVIDHDVVTYTVELLREWKRSAEKETEGRFGISQPAEEEKFIKDAWNPCPLQSQASCPIPDLSRLARACPFPATPSSPGERTT